MVGTRVHWTGVLAGSAVLAGALWTPAVGQETVLPEGRWAPVAVRAPAGAQAGRLSQVERRDQAGGALFRAGPARLVLPAVPADVPRRTMTGMAGGVPASRAVGRVFFTDAASGRRSSCSASVVASDSGNLLLTAGHCVYSRGWHRDWIFVPSYDQGKRPFGVWRAEWFVTPSRWITHGRPEDDVAFVKVASSGGVRILDRVGGNGIRPGAATGRRRTVLGYPFLPPYRGDRQHYCEGVTRSEGRRMRMACRLTTGASGGPWLDSYDRSTGFGYIGGVTTNTDLANTTLWSPLLGGDVWTLYRYADQLR